MNTRFFFLPLAILTAISSFLSLYKLHSLPPGLWFDEAMNGLSALEALDSGTLRVFYANNGGREGLLINLQAALLTTMLPTPYVLRLVPALFGVGSVLCMFFFVFQLTAFCTDRSAGERMRIAFYSASLLALSTWHIHMSRLGVRAGLMEFFLLGALSLMLVALKPSLRYSWIAASVLSGVMYGLGFYTYIPYRATVLIVATLCLILHRQPRMLLVSTLFTVSAAATAAPLAIYFYRFPASFTGRMSRLSARVNDYTLEKILQPFDLLFGDGLSLIRHGIPGSPLIPAGILVLILAGIPACIAGGCYTRRAAKSLSASGFLLIWFLVGILPGVLAEAGANRILLAAAPLHILAGYGLWQITVWIRRTPTGRVTAPLAASLILIWTGASTYRSYFIDWPAVPGINQAFTAHSVSVSNYLKANPTQKIYIIRDRHGHLVIAGIRFLLNPHATGPERSAVIFPRKGNCPPASKTPHQCIFITGSSWRIQSVPQSEAPPEIQHE